VSPIVVNVGTGAPMATRVAQEATGELEASQTEIARLQERVGDLEADKAYLQTALAAALTNTQRLLEAPPRRRWRWPWERRGE